MKHQFTLPSFPYSNFEIEVSFCTGKQTLYKDEVVVCISPSMMKADRWITGRRN